MKTLIAVCGRTNVGKTAFITTLRHKYSGKIRDESSTTTDITDYPHETLSIILSDFPGFEKIAAVESYLNIEKENPGLAINIRDLILKDEISKRDYELIQELKNKDLVFVVCSIENVPEASHMAEINLIKSANPNIIAIISKTGIYEKNDRINTWITFLERMGIKSHIEFDAHFDSKYKIIDLMVFVSNILPEGDKVENLKLSMGIFKNTLEKQHKRIREGFVKVISSIASLELRATLKSELNIQLSNFKLQVSKAFELYIESITSSLGITIDEFNNITNSIKANIVETHTPYETMNSITKGVARGVATTLIAVIGGSISPFLAIAGAVYYALGDGEKLEEQVAKILPTKNIHIVKLTISEINDLAKIGVLVYWMASKFGYARRYMDGKESDLLITQKDIDQFRSRLSYISTIRNITFENLETWFDSAIAEVELKAEK